MSGERMAERIQTGSEPLLADPDRDPSGLCHIKNAHEKLSPRPKNLKGGMLKV